MFKNYLFGSIAQIFFPFFIVLFFISSVVLLISIANITLVVKMNFMDLLLVFLYLMPGTVFFIIPITFFAACVLGLSRLSFDYELLVFFSLGVSPRKILAYFIPIAGIVSLVLLFFSLALIPLSKSAYSDFIAEKRTKIDVNIRAGDLGQKLGDWLVYIDSIKDNEYRDLVLFSGSDLGQESFVVAQKGRVENLAGVFRLSLQNGDAYFAKNNELQKVNFQNMMIQSEIKKINLSSYDLVAYWKSAFEGKKSQARRFSQAIMTSLFPLASIFFIPLFGIANPRFQRNLSYVYILSAVVGYFAGVHILSENAPFFGIFALPLAWFFLGYYFFRKKILKVY
ncbi:LptF/LptG family permease [Helicobacter mustelae]|uniref:Putative integral membrane protein, permease YjgP/YjgQ family n=1 Tax=Helicobacter mustelae (strain ATCC 43772 / CCUG 25715 / CIP 103759 / LMG 18044 / NCTC 12198 / R85-136P) TaxID=679897 RepID=D3UH25_HELM1|nr:LptF/LptG family permease [Helicobacter mustelae]CBG39797.1 putative integral membrane protein, permease YjgP/YjgQ family [Helicobacter mustelae 12198]SQH71305.1 YjgP/YjgQ family permease [Helicobacter mustelae]STP12431.1 YjgP/YjgQ family permease [Helicobacter mustelae]